MKKYILFIFGFAEEELIVETLADLEKISDEIKFFGGPTYSIYHFESKDSVEDIRQVLLDYLEEMIESFFIFSLEGEHAIEMDEQLKTYFLDTKFTKPSDERKSNKEGRDIGIIPIQELLTNYLDKLPKKQLTVNSLLDKIIEDGVESLNKEEKDFLDNQGKLTNGK
jgi:hypothetical protein|tara:strand:- start:462 stop:962 length:501 start_codon:yes stop_codon:yes gene_type:complete